MRTATLVGSAAALLWSVAATAVTQGFSGTFQNANQPAALGGRCAVLTVNIANGPAPTFATGTSNFGAFTGVQSHCLDGPPPIAPGSIDRPYYDGRFTYSFAAGGTLFGTYDGMLTNGGTAGLINNVQNFVITGGTGQFTGATGAFIGTGTIRFGNGLPVGTLAFSGEVGGVPEPATWGMLIVGMGAVGATMRRRSRVPVRMTA